MKAANSFPATSYAIVGPAEAGCSRLLCLRVRPFRHTYKSPLPPLPRKHHGPYFHKYALTTRVSFWPPKPKELERQARTGIFREALGT